MRNNKHLQFTLSLRFRLIILVVLAALPALILTLYTGIEQREQAEVIAKKDALQNVLFAASKHELLIESTRSLIISLTHSVFPEGDALLGCDHLFAHLKETHFPFYAAFYIADLKGNVLCTLPGGDVPKDLINCTHYNNLLASDQFEISEYHICKNSGRGVISMGYPIYNPNEEKIGIVNVSIDLKWFGDLLQGSNLPLGSTLTIFDVKGTILAHYPESDQWVGSKLPEDSIEQQILLLGQGTIRGRGLDNIEYLYAFLPLAGSEESVFLSVGIPTEYAYGEVNKTLTRNLALSSAVTIILLVAAWVLGGLFIIRPIGELVNTTQQIAEGNLDIRASSGREKGEFGILADSINNMAEALSLREKEQIQAKNAIHAYTTELERSNRDLQDFANIASHDIQEPLRKIANFTDILLQRYSKDLDKNAKEYLNRIQASVQKLHEFILALLNFSRISTKTQPFEQVDLNKTVKAVLTDLEVQLNQVDAEITLEKLPIIQADPIQMHQLFLNLISNSLKFRNLETKTKIKIYGQDKSSPSFKKSSEAPDSPCHWIFVSDNGIGFDEKYLDKIFQPFQRLHRYDEYSGSGMGLAICRKILEYHGGEITAKSEPGKGATFIITYPCQSI